MEEEKDIQAMEDKFYEDLDKLKLSNISLVKASELSNLSLTSALTKTSDISFNSDYRLKCDTLEKENKFTTEKNGELIDFLLTRTKENRMWYKSIDGRYECVVISDVYSVWDDNVYTTATSFTTNPTENAIHTLSYDESKNLLNMIKGFVDEEANELCQMIINKTSQDKITWEILAGEAVYKYHATVGDFTIDFKENSNNNLYESFKAGGNVYRVHHTYYTEVLKLVTKQIFGEELVRQHDSHISLMESLSKL
jgi:hypothetical protein